MIPWEELGRATVPGQDSELVLRQRGQEFSIRTAGTELMNSRIYGSEQALATLVFEQTGQRPGMRVLVGGLGMGLYPGPNPGTVFAGHPGEGGRTDPGGHCLEPGCVRASFGHAP